MRPLSKRLLRIEPSGVRELFEIASRYGDVINLTLGEPEVDTPSNIKEAAWRALKEGFTHYTTNAGIRELREAIAERYLRDYGVRVDPDSEVIVTQGATQAILMSMTALLDQGDEVVVFTPAFVAYQGVAQILGSPVVEVATEIDNGFKPSVDDIRRAITRRTKLIVVNNPCNPTGAVYNRQLLTGILEVAVEHDLYVISDEVYEKFVFDGEHTCMLSLSGAKDRVLVIGSFSKTYAMTGWRLGYVIARDDIITNILKLQVYNGVCPNSFAQKAAVEAIRGPQDFVAWYREELRKRLDYSYKRLREVSGAQVYKPEGAFYIFPRIALVERMGSINFCKKLLEEEGVALVPGRTFGPRYDGHVRISFTASLGVLEEAFDRLERFVSRHEGRS